MKSNTQRIITQSLIQMIWVDVLLISIYAMVTQWAGHTPARPDIILLGALLLVQWVQMLALYWQAAKDAAGKAQEPPQEPSNQEPEAVDPWKIQKALMKASGQDLPTRPVLNRGGLLYAALLLEEVGETMAGFASAIRESDTPDRPVNSETNALLVINLLFRNTAYHLIEESKRLREILQDVTSEFELSRPRAIEILDGTTDVAVVNSGLALAMGFPGAEAYLEVGCSNLSKANPATGVIDKTPDGTWIKGSQYFPPNLASVLSIHEDYSAK